VYAEYIGSKKPPSIEEDETVNVAKLEEKGWTGFMKEPDTGKLFIYNYMLKGMVKHAGNTLKTALGIKALRSKLDDIVFISPRKIYLNQNEPDGVNERPIRVTTQQGPRVALIRSDYINEGKILDFEVTLVHHDEVTWEVVEKLLHHGQLMGLGQFRNGGYGQFKVLPAPTPTPTLESVTAV
jgi:hypothetical protein